MFKQLADQPAGNILIILKPLKILTHAQMRLLRVCFLEAAHILRQGGNRTHNMCNHSL